MLRVLIDTNVLVSGTLVAQGASARILKAAREHRIIVLMTPAILAEYELVIGRSRIAGKYPGVQARAADLVNFLIAATEILNDEPSRTGLILSDAKDDVVVSCALEGRADYIVSGDRHLTDIKEFNGVTIVTPAEFVRIANL